MRRPAAAAAAVKRRASAASIRRPAAAAPPDAESRAAGGDGHVVEPEEPETPAWIDQNLYHQQRILLPLITRGVRSAKRRGMAALVANPLQPRALKDTSGWMARWSGKSLPERWQSQQKTQNDAREKGAAKLRAVSLRLQLYFVVFEKRVDSQH